MIALAEWRKAAAHFEAHGFRLACWSSPQPAEERPWLLLLHGFPTSSWDWSALWPALERHFNLAAFDMLGFGLSDKPRDIRYRLVDQADFAEALLERLGVGEAHLFAHDYGVSVAQELLARQEEAGLSFSVKSICFLNGGLFPDQHRARPIQKIALTPAGPLLRFALSRDSLRRNFDQIFGEQTKASDDEIDGHWALIEENGGRAVFHKLMAYIPERRANADRWEGALVRSRAPLRLINGGADPVSGRHLYESYRERLPGADAVLLDDIGHYPHTEAPKRVLDAFFAFHGLKERSSS